MGFFISLFLFIVIDAILGSILYAFGVDMVYIHVVVSLVIAFIFSYMNSAKPALKQLAFHRNFAFIFIVLLFLRFVFNYV
jgi:hypothetical protein